MMAGKTEQEPTGSTPDAIAWRMSRVEGEVSNLRTEIIGKLDSMASNYATHKDLEDAKQQAKDEHKLIELKIDTTRAALDTKINDVQQDVSNLKKRDWIRNTLSAILGAVLALLISYFFNGVIKK